MDFGSVHVGSGIDRGHRRFVFAIQDEAVHANFFFCGEIQLAVIIQLHIAQADGAGIGNHIHYGEFRFAARLGADIQHLFADDIGGGLHVHHAGIDDGQLAEADAALLGYDMELGVPQLAQAIYDQIAQDDVRIGFNEGVGQQLILLLFRKILEFHFAGCVDLQRVILGADRTFGISIEDYIARRGGDVGFDLVAHIVVIDQAALAIVHLDGNARADDFAQLVLGFLYGFLLLRQRAFIGFNAAIRTDNLAVLALDECAHLHGKHRGAGIQAGNQFCRGVFLDAIPNAVVEQIVFLLAVHIAHGQNAFGRFTDDVQIDRAFGDDQLAAGLAGHGGYAERCMLDIFIQVLVHKHGLIGGFRVFHLLHRRPKIAAFIQFIVIVLNIAGNRFGDCFQHDLLRGALAVAGIIMLQLDVRQEDHIGIFAHQFGDSDLFRFICARDGIIGGRERRSTIGHFDHAIADGIKHGFENHGFAVFRIADRSLFNVEAIGDAICVARAGQAVVRKLGFLDSHAVHFTNNGDISGGRSIKADFITLLLRLRAGAGSAGAFFIVHRVQRQADFLQGCIGEIIMIASQVFPIKPIISIIIGSCALPHGDVHPAAGILLLGHLPVFSGQFRIHSLQIIIRCAVGCIHSYAEIAVAQAIHFRELDFIG